jgi:hypothetical protein
VLLAVHHWRTSFVVLYLLFCILFLTLSTSPRVKQPGKFPGKAGCSNRQQYLRVCGEYVFQPGEALRKAVWRERFGASTYNAGLFVISFYIATA